MRGGGGRRPGGGGGGGAGGVAVSRYPHRPTHGEPRAMF